MSNLVIVTMALVFIRELVLTDKSANFPADTFNCTTMKEDLNSIEDSDNYENWSYLSLL